MTKITRAAKAAAAKAPATFTMTNDMIGPSKLDTQAGMAIGLHEAAIHLDGNDAKAYSPSALLGAVFANGNKRERIVSVTKQQRGIYLVPEGEVTDVVVTDKGTEILAGDIVRVKLTGHRLFTKRGSKIVANRSDVATENGNLKRFMGEQPLICVGQALTLVNVEARRKRARNKLDANLQDPKFLAKHANLFAAVENHNAKTTNAKDDTMTTSTRARTLKATATKTTRTAKEATTMTTKTVRTTKPVAAKVTKPVVKAPAKRVRKPRVAKVAKRVIDVAAFATSKRIVSDLVIAKLTEANDLIVTREGQPEAKRLIGKALWVQLGEKRPENYGVVSDVIVTVGTDGNKIVYLLEAVCGDTTFPLHSIDKVGAKFIVDLKAELPTRANTALIGVDEIMVSKRPAPARAARTPRVSRTANAKADAGDKAPLVVGEHEMKPSEYTKGASIIIDPSVKGDKIAKVFIKTIGRGTKKDPVRRVRHVHTVKGQISPLNELRRNRSGFKAINL